LASKSCSRALTPVPGGAACRLWNTARLKSAIVVVRSDVGTKMRRIVNGFQADWIGNERIELIRTTVPMHHYFYETSPDRKRLKSREATSPVDVEAGDPLVDADRFNEEAWKAAQEYLRLESAA
jgi:hypothetical protein